MAAYRRVYDSRHLQTDCQEPRDQLRDPTLDNRLWATFLPFFAKLSATAAALRSTADASDARSDYTAYARSRHASTQS